MSVEAMASALPRVQAWRGPHGMLLVSCPFCFKVHGHGITGGQRAAPCGGDSPLRDYIIEAPDPGEFAEAIERLPTALPPGATCPGCASRLSGPVVRSLPTALTLCMRCGAFIVVPVGAVPLRRLEAEQERKLVPAPYRREAKTLRQYLHALARHEAACEQGGGADTAGSAGVLDAQQDQAGVADMLRWRGGRYHAVLARVEREEAEAEHQRKQQRQASSDSAADNSRRGDRHVG